MLKSLIMFVVAACITTSAFARTFSMGVEVEHYVPKYGSINTNSIAFVPAFSFGSNTIDAKLQNFRTTDKVNSSSYELRIKHDLLIYKNVTVYGRAGLGNKQATNVSVATYTIEPGVKMYVNHDWTVDASYKYGNATNSSHPNEKTKASYIGATYRLTNTDSIEANVFRDTGSVVGTGINVGYTRSF